MAIPSLKPYEILEHTGDAKIRAFGKTKEELFLNALKGMMALLKPKIKNQKSKPKIRKIKITSPDVNSLLVDFLSEVNYLVQTRCEVYEDATFVKLSDTEVEAQLYGRAVEEFGEEIKAVTHHGLEIRQNPEGMREATVIFDV